MDAPKEHTRCPARGTCPVFLAMSSGAVCYTPSVLGPALDGNLGEEPWDPDSQPHPDEGHPPPLEAVPVPCKSVGPCKSHRTESPRGLAETPGGEEAQGEEGPAAAPLDVLRLRSSSMEIREKGSEFLKEELHKAQKELKLKDEECERLSRVREQLERELEELTASLFEGLLGLWGSDETWMSGARLRAAPGEPYKGCRGILFPVVFDTKAAPSPLLPYVSGASREEVRARPLPLPPLGQLPRPPLLSSSTCALSGLARACRHRIRLGDSENHYYISPSSRARITAVCNFLTYIRYIQQGLVRQEAEPMFWEITRLRKEMSLAKLGFFPQEA
uniref:RAB3A interacting protein like 1 n=1 Tax=Panthera tigris altaica TaxID=74533 RepID=A0A8C9KB10_PANTA